MTILASNESAIARMMRADLSEVEAFAASMPESRRVHFALFCFARTHFRELGLLLASHCSAYTLKAAGGYAGDFLAEQAAKHVPTPTAGLTRQKAISLATLNAPSSPASTCARSSKPRAVDDATQPA